MSDALDAAVEKARLEVWAVIPGERPWYHRRPIRLALDKYAAAIAARASAPLAEALEKYGQHNEGCQLRWHDRPDGIVADLQCDCGLRAALAAHREKMP